VMGMGAMGIEIHEEAVRMRVPSATRRILPPRSGVSGMETGRVVVAFRMEEPRRQFVARACLRLFAIVILLAATDKDGLVLLFIVDYVN
jgi:hypothetical protein